MSTKKIRPRLGSSPLAGALTAALSKPAAKSGRTTFAVALSVAERVRDAAHWTPGLTVTGLVESAVLREVERLETARGEIFPPRS